MIKVKSGPLFFIVIAPVLLFNCNVTDPEISIGGKDTLYVNYYTFETDTTFYSWKEENGSLHITTERPYIGDTVPRMLAFYLRTTEPFSPVNACSTFVNNPNVADTVVIVNDMVRTAFRHDTLKLEVAPEAVANYQKTHGPWFTKKDSVKALLDTVREGIKNQILIPAMHYQGDSAVIRIESKPYFIKSIGSIITVQTDSVFLDSVFEWSIFVENRFGLKDSLELKTVVKP